MTLYNATDMIRVINRTYGLPEAFETQTASPIRLQRWLTNLIRRRAPGALPR